VVLSNCGEACNSVRFSYGKENESRHNRKAAKLFFRKLLKGMAYVPRVIIANKLKSYGAANAKLCPVLNSGNTRDSTTEPNCRTNLPDKKSGR
jgi:transposase-like protein